MVATLLCSLPIHSFTWAARPQGVARGLLQHQWRTGVWQCVEKAHQMPTWPAGPGWGPGWQAPGGVGPEQSAPVAGDTADLPATQAQCFHSPPSTQPPSCHGRVGAVPAAIEGADCLAVEERVRHDLTGLSSFHAC